jgi:mono/diheme cytochrome c family protein
MKIILVLTSAYFFTACTGVSDKPNIEVVQDLMVTPAAKSQSYDVWSPDHRSMREPPEHTVPVGFHPYRFTKDPEGAVKNPNPFAGNTSNENLVMGQRNFAIHCAVCHGDAATGDSLVAAKMALKPPSLMTEKIRGWTDGQIYNVIAVGQGLMGPYASHIPDEKTRWAVVNYIRHLQKETK